MVDATERLLNLAMFLAHRRRPITAEECRMQVVGYPEDQDDAAFGRMFERDKEDLRAAGFTLAVVDRDGKDAYTIDDAASHLRRVELSAEDVDALAAAAAALSADPSYPFAAELRTAVTKVLGGPPPRTSSEALLADERPKTQAGLVETLIRASIARKTVSFAYVNAAGTASARSADPYGLFLREGRWYLVAHDHASGEVRVFAVSRMACVATAPRPKHPDFERPEGFALSLYRILPFQLGGPVKAAALRFSQTTAWKAKSLTGGKGVLVEEPDDSLTWRVEAADERALARWVVENGPGIVLEEPAEAREILLEGLRKAVEAHGARG